MIHTTAAELFAIADLVTSAANRGRVSGITEPLGDALVKVLNAAKTAAFNEALAAHNAATQAPRKDSEGT